MRPNCSLRVPSCTDAGWIRRDRGGGLTAPPTHLGHPAMDAGSAALDRRAAGRQPAPAPARAGAGPGRSHPCEQEQEPTWLARGAGGVLRRARAPRTSLNRPIGAERRLALIRTRLETARQVAHAHHAKINDVVLAAVAGGLRALLREPWRGRPTLTLRATVPISLHRDAPQAGGNQDARWWCRCRSASPTRPPTRTIAAETAARKRQARPRWATNLSRFAAVQRRIPAVRAPVSGR